MQIKHISGTRGHIILELTDGRYVYVPGELTMDARFYAVVSQEWYWAKGSARNSVLPGKEDFLETVTPGEKAELMDAVKDTDREGSIRIIFD